MVETNSSGYKDRYLQALDDIERMEKKHSFQLDLMRRTLMMVASAAQGLEKNLDVSLIKLKDSLRGASGPQVVQDMEAVQRAVKSFERLRDSEHKAVAEKMQQAVQPFQALCLDSDLKDKLRNFSRGLTAAMTSYRSYPRILAELTLLQQAAVEQAMSPPTGFFERLKGGRTLKAKELEAPVVCEAALRPEQLQLAPDPAVKPEHSVGPSLAEYEDTHHHTVNHLLEEDSYEKVAGRIALTLRELVDNIEPNDVIRHRVDLVKARIQRGMDWYALSATLEDIRDVLMQRYLDVDREFSQYLQEVNRELASISQVLGVALEREAEVNSAAAVLSETVADEVSKIQSSVEGSTSLDSLKQAVSTHLDVIQDALKDYRKVHEQQAAVSLSDELKKLLIKVETAEQESSRTKEMLAAERYRATHDALTGLPNREAYNERAFHELGRFQRYGHKLTMSVCDIDHFKAINDNYGHQAGDKVLKLIAKVILARLRKIDFVGRYGGEEFVILLPETSAAQAKKVLDKIRTTIGRAAFRFKDSPVSINVSFGITGFVAEDSVESAFARADKALYQAKSEGRNRCVVVEPDGDPQAQ